MNSNYDAIVIGLGGVGSAALYELARRGMHVVGIDRFGVAHNQGSSHGESRIIRRSYFEHPDYVPLVDGAFALWRRLETETQTRLFHKTGLFLSGPAEGEVVSGTCRARDSFDLTIETVSASDAARRFACFRPDNDSSILFESDAGFLKVEDCVTANIESAVRLGAEVLTDRRVAKWEPDGGGVRVILLGETLCAARLAICCGPWSSTLLQLELPLEVLRKPVFWFHTDDRRFHLDEGCPIYGFETMGGFFYGFPSLDGRTVKIAEHTGRQAADPDSVNRSVDNADAARCIQFAASHLPTVRPTIARHSVCMYTMTPDQHFIVDRHPHHPQVAMAAGFSGHGFKFAPVIAEMLADFLVQDHFTGVDLFRIARSALTS